MIDLFDPKLLEAGKIAYDKGYRAESILDNPYKDGSIEARHWVQGYYDKLVANG